MSEHRATLAWSRGGAPFTYETYPRDHVVRFEGGVELPASAAPAYQGSPDRVDPEAAFVGALSSCHMLTFLALAARKRLVVDAYTDDAVGYLEKNEDGKLAVTRATLRPRVTFAKESAPTPAETLRLHHLAHENCFIASSVKTAVSVEPAE